MTLRICLLISLFTCAPKPIEVRFVPEMASIPEETWERCDPSQFTQPLQQAALLWIQKREHILHQLTDQKVRELSKWAKKEMADYHLPTIKNQTFRATHSHNNENLLIESVLDTLPAHHPLVTRHLKLYLVYHRKHNTLTDAIITIRGWAEE